MDQRMLYGVTIHDSIKRGDHSEMQSLLTEAQRQHSELGQAIQDLRKAVGGGGTGPMPMYGAPIADAIRKGDKAEMQQLLQQARSAHEQQGDLGKAIKDLENALGHKSHS